MRVPSQFAPRTLLLALLLGAAPGCVRGPIRGPRGILADRVLIFEQRVAASDPSAEPAWESWQLYDSGRFVYARAGAEPTQRRIETARLQAVHAWLYAHDTELQQQPASTPGAPALPPSMAMCQVHTSRGLMLAAFGELHYEACEELKKLAIPE